MIQTIFRLRVAALLKDTIVWTAVVLATSSWSSAADESSPAESGPLTATAELNRLVSDSTTGLLTVQLQIAKPYKAYADKIKLTVLEPANELSLGALTLEPLIEFQDTFSKSKKLGLKEKGTITAPVDLKNTDPKSVKLKLTYQACTTEHCLFPKSIELIPKLIFDKSRPTAQGARVDLPAAISEKAADQTADLRSESSGSASDSSAFASALKEGLFSAVIFMFIAGFLTSLTPCIYPMIPITLAILGANTKTADQSSRAFHLKAFLLSVFYVLGIATTYSILGVAAASTGALFGSALSNVWIVTGLAILFVVMGLSMFGLFELQAPAFIRDRLGQGKSKASFGKSYLTGLAAGVVASPCVGPVLVSVLAYIAQTQDRALGFILLFSFAMGMGLLFIAIGTSSSLLKSLPKAGSWMDGIKFVFGTTMVAMALYYVKPVYPAWLFVGLTGLAVLMIASAYGAFSAAVADSISKQIQKGLAIAMFVIGVAMVLAAVFDRLSDLGLRIGFTSGGGVSAGAGLGFANSSNGSSNSVAKLNWQPYSDEVLAKAKADGRPVIIDFWADWCGACHELEQLTFPDPKIQALAKDFVLLKVDATTDNPLVDRLKKTYTVMGLPTLVFFGPNGARLTDLTLTGFEDADAFLARMQSALK